MEDDLIAGLTRQVKEEVVENYLNERYLIQLQKDEMEERAGQLKLLAEKTGRRLTRIAFLLVHPDMVHRFMAILQLPQSCFWNKFLDQAFSKGVRFIRVRALTDKIKYKKLVMEAYERLCMRMEVYRKSYEELSLDSKAVNRNITAFQRNYDLLSILSFLRSLDIQALEQKHFLGENFTADEMASLDATMYIKNVDLERLDIPQPLSLPPFSSIEHKLGDLVSDIYKKYEREVRRLLLS